MRKVMIWFLLSCKRYLKQLPFLAILLFLPLAAFGANKAQQQGQQQIRIALWAETAKTQEETAETLEQSAKASSDDLAASGTGAAADDAALSLEVRLVKQLTENSAGKKGMFQFYSCVSEQQVKDEVASRRAECGYVISQNLQEKLEEGSFKRSITVYSAPSTVAASLSTETVFAALMELYDKEILENYAATGEAFSGLGEPGSHSRLEAASQAGELYDKWKENGSTFHFQYVYGMEEKSVPGQENQTEAREASQLSVFPVRGIVALCMFVTGLYGAVVLMRDEKRGLFHPLDYRLKLPCRLAALAAPIALSALSGLLSLQAGDDMGNFGKEAAAIICYGLTVLAFSWLMKTILPSPELLCCVIPFFIIGSLIFCPIFIDAGKFFPALDSIGRLFLPWYYLNWPSGLL